MNRSPKIPNSKPKHLRVAAVQMIFADSIASNLEKIEHAAIKAAAAGADVVLFPECATTGYACDFGALKPSAVRQALRAVAAVAARLRVNLLVGSPIFAGRRLYNAMVVFDRRGRLIHSYASLKHTRFLASHWRSMLPELRRRVRETDRMFQRWFESNGSASVS